MLCWQLPGLTIDAYTRDFKAKIKVCKAVGSAISIREATTKLACKTTGHHYNTLSISNQAGDIVMLKKMEKMGRTQYLAALHFEGPNRMGYSAL